MPIRRPGGLVEDKRTESIIGGFYEVYNTLGFGFSELVYASALERELRWRGHKVVREVLVEVLYKGEIVGEHRPDLVVAETVVVDIKSVERLAPVHSAQMRTYLRITGLEVGLLLNFNEPVLKDGIQRVVLQPGVKSL